MFLSKYNKTYKSEEERQRRFAIYKMNMDKIRKHNDEYKIDKTTYTMKENITI